MVIRWQVVLGIFTPEIIRFWKNLQSKVLGMIFETQCTCKSIYRPTGNLSSYLTDLIIFYIITNLQGSHAHFPAIYLTFHAITCLLVPMHFEFPQHKYIILFLFISVKLKHSPLSDIILRLIIFSLLILSPSAALLMCPDSREILVLYKLLLTYLTHRFGHNLLVTCTCNCDC